MSILETLKDTRGLLSDKSKWTNGGNYASDVDGAWINPLHEAAVCWCSLGAIMKITNKNAVSDPLVKACEKELGITVNAHGGIVHYNDEHTHKQVLKIFDKTIARLEGN